MKVKKAFPDKGALTPGPPQRWVPDGSLEAQALKWSFLEEENPLIH